MRMKIIVASLFAIGLASPALSQSNPAPTGATIDRNTNDAGGGASADTKKPMAADPTMTGSTTSSGSVNANCNGNEAASSTGSGNLQTQGGSSNATPMDEACSAHNN
ncbi:hypothetical protein [Rhizobium sp. BK418]|uniref:hypothetical protein n=1 Tax=Rhizobium sp. BK418 TaxID=2512120 RepID=UPI00104D9510|nr:hypothetical protein [Rhizobium sp. BK418]TCR96266.1 hypothetical protein EV281_11133 [Rhizobium sp. BK418]